MSPGDAAADREATEAAEAARRRARRAAARRLHPDAGGDPAAFDAAMKALRPESVREAPKPGPGVVTFYAPRRRRVGRRASALARAAAGGVRRRLPPSWPGARRFGTY